jgi:hypothetical protein
MTHLARTIVATALFALALSANAEAVRLASPQAGVTLRGGSLAEVRWTAQSLPEGTEEWEAFLSVDGGRYYAFRITPHLDIDQHRFTFVVPNVDTRDARILIRTGNEIDETHFESPDRFAIVRDADADLVLPRVAKSGRAEAARDGDPSVLFWTDGGRDASGVTQQAALPVEQSSVTTTVSLSESQSAITAPAVAVREPLPTFEQRSIHVHQASSFEPLAPSRDLLLVCHRRNI